MINEIKTNANGNTSWFPGSNAYSETAASYIMAGGYSINVSTPTASIGYPEMNLIMNIFGEERSGGCCGVDCE